MTAFDYVNSINFTKKNLMVGTENDERSEKDYVPFLTNRSLSYFVDTLLYANEMNMYGHLDNKLQYSFLLNTIRPKKRFSKWAKSDVTDDIMLISQFFQFSIPKAREAIALLTENQINDIRELVTRGTREDDNHRPDGGSNA